MSNLEEIMEERAKTHGDWHRGNVLEVELLEVIERYYGDVDVDVDTMCAVRMIVHKLRRILIGDSNFADHWDDIAGYATLKANSVRDKSRHAYSSHSERDYGTFEKVRTNVG